VFLKTRPKISSPTPTYTTQINNVHNWIEIIAHENAYQKVYDNLEMDASKQWSNNS